MIVMASCCHCCCDRLLATSRCLTCRPPWCVVQNSGGETTTEVGTKIGDDGENALLARVFMYEFLRTISPTREADSSWVVFLLCVVFSASHSFLHQRRRIIIIVVDDGRLGGGTLEVA